MKLNNKYFLLRHGQALSNAENIISCWPEQFHNPLTKKGAGQVINAIKKIKNIQADQSQNIDLIFSSDVLRAQQTAQIVSENFCVKPKFDKRLREYNFGEMNGTFLREFQIIFPDIRVRFQQKPKGGENYAEIAKRMWSFFTEINKQYFGKNILIVSHQVPLSLLLGKIYNLSEKQIFKQYFGKKEIGNAQIIEIK